VSNVSKHNCAAAGCRASIPEHLLMCSPHWQMLSLPLRNRITAQYQAMKGGNLESGKAYQKSLSEAIAFIVRLN